MEVNGGVMSNTHVQVDGITYKNVIFNNCTMVYTGSGGAMGFIGCTFNNCNWQFAGPAGNALQFIKDLMDQPGARKKEFLEGIFGKIND